jgi:cystathionine beta-lyase/cystathionine gamma-synthase
MKYLVVYEKDRVGENSVWAGSVLNSESEVREFISNEEYRRKHEKIMSIDEIFEYLRKMKRFRTPGYGFSVIEFEG